MTLDYRVPINGCCRIRIQGKAVQIAHDENEYCLRLSQGMAYLCALLEYPGLPFRPWQLERPQRDQAASEVSDMQAVAYHEAKLAYCDLHQGMPVADARTLYEVKQRLLHLLESIAMAKENCDLGALEKMRDEEEQLTRYLSEAYWPGGRVREFPHEQRKQELRVNKSIKRAIMQVEAVDHVLGRYLLQQIKLGNWISYVPGSLEIELLRF